MILGIDEVGRGCWAGPLVMGAVVLGDVVIDGLTDSKALSAKRRAALAVEINDKAAAVGLGWVAAREIDGIGLSAALKLACRRAVEQIRTPYHEIIIDGTVNFLAETNKAPYVTVLKKADLLIPAASAASIVAKEVRDDYMRQQSKEFPEFGFADHVGYGTAKHRAAIEQFGVCELHRLSFGPLKKYAGSSRVVSESSARTTKVIGDTAEAVVAKELERRGHEIVARNWKTKYCEVDIISVRGDVIYFTEVKYRKNADYGDGLAVITAKKQRQMKFAAELFLAKYHQFASHKPLLAAVDVGGEPPKIQQMVELT